MVQEGVLSQGFDYFMEAFISKVVFSDGQRSQVWVLFEVLGQELKLFILKLHLGQVYIHNLSVPDEFQGGNEQLNLHFFQVEHSMVSFDLVKGQLVELTPVLFGEFLEFKSDVTFYGDVIFQVLSDDAWRHLAQDSLQSYVLLQGWFEIVDQAGLSDLQPGQVDERKA